MPRKVLVLLSLRRDVRTIGGRTLLGTSRLRLISESLTMNVPMRGRLDMGLHSLVFRSLSGLPFGFLPLNRFRTSCPSSHPTRCQVSSLVGTCMLVVSGMVSTWWRIGRACSPWGSISEVASLCTAFKR